MHQRSLSWLSLLLLAGILFSALPPAPRLSARISDRSPRAPECYHRANPPFDVLCLVVLVQRLDGTPVPDAEVTARFAGQELESRTEQLLGREFGDARAALDVGLIGATPGDLVALRVEHGAARQDLYVGLRPNPATRTQVLDPVVIDAPAQLGLPPISGTVLKLDAPEPIAGAVVKLYQGDQLLDEDVTSTRASNDKPTFALDPGSPPLNTILRVEVTYEKQERSVEFPWERNGTILPLVLGWSCVFSGPRYGGGEGLPRYGGGEGLPDDFCLTIEARLENTAMADAQVSIEIGDLPPILRTTSLITGLVAPAVAVNIGPEALDLPDATPVRVAASLGSFIGVFSTTLGDLPIGERWGATWFIPLRRERMSAGGLVGGTPQAITAIGGDDSDRSLYVSLPAGGGIAAQHGAGTSWMRLLGESRDGLPVPDITAMLALRRSGTEDHLLAGARSGAIFQSYDSGQRWLPLSLPTTIGPILGLAHDNAGAVYALGRGGVLRMTEVGTPRPGSGPATADLVPLGSFSPTSLVILSDRYLVGALDGLWEHRPGGTWQQLNTMPVLALALAPGGAGLLVGGPAGLSLTDLSGANAAPLGITGAVFGIAIVEHDSSRIVVTGAEGVFITQASDLNSWEHVAGSDTLTTVLPTVGAPDLLDIVALPGGALASATSTGVYTSPDGLNWQPLPISEGNEAPSHLTGPTRSVSAQGEGQILILTRDNLLRWSLEGASILSNLPTALNGSIVRASANGETVLVGRGPGSGASLYVSIDGGGSFMPLSLGADSGVSDIAFLNTAVGVIEAVIATEGDGLFGWSSAAPGTVIRYQRLPDSTGEPARITSVMVRQGNTCRILVGTAGPEAGVATRPCTVDAGDWSALTGLIADGKRAGAIYDLAHDGASRTFAATSEGLFSSDGTAWQRIFGLPLRPLTLAVPAQYATDRLLVAGGPQSGAVLLSDISPDLRVTITGPATLRGGTEGVYTVTLRNQGLLTHSAGTFNLELGQGQLSLEPLDTQLTHSFGELRSGQSVNFTLRLRAGADAKPAQSSLRATTTPIEADRFKANNQATRRIMLDYRSGPDLAVIIGGQSMSKPGERAQLRLTLINLGDQPAQAGGQLQAALPPGVTILSNTGGASQSGTQRTWPISALSPGQSAEFSIDYRLASGTPESAALPIVASILNNEDREPQNDQDNGTLRVRPSSPRQVVVTNMTRLARLGLISDLRTALDGYLEAAAAIEVALDGGPPCPGPNSANLACRYKTFDIAVAALAKEVRGQNRTAKVDELADAALLARAQLVSAIRAEIDRQLDIAGVSPKEIYILGGDSVIPGGAALDVHTYGQSNDPEARHATSLAPTDTLYGLLRANHYPTYRSYETIGDRQLVLGVQPGTPNEIAAVLTTYVANGGQISLTGALVSGSALKLTEDIQRATCEMLKFRGVNVTQACDNVPTSVKAGLETLAGLRALVSASDHSDQWNLGDLSSRKIAAMQLNLVNLLLLLGCHTGLVPEPDPQRDPSLISALATGGQVAYGYLGYAYAYAPENQNVVTLSYGERLHYLLVERLLGGDLSVGEALRKARSDYGLSTDLKDSKTLDTLALFGPPGYRVSVAGALGQPAFVVADVTGTELAQTSISATYIAQTSTNGTVYVAHSSAGPTRLRAIQGHTLQSELILAAPGDATGGLISTGSYHDLPGLNPLIPRIAPIGVQPDYTEPGYLGPAVDRAAPLRSFRDGDDVLQVEVALGSWQRDGMVQRLIDQLGLEFIAPSAPFSSPALIFDGAARIGHGSDGVRVSTPGGRNLNRVEVILFHNGQITRHPMTQTNSQWVAVIAALPGAQLLIQAAGEDGRALFDTNGERLYTIPGTEVSYSDPCTTFTTVDLSLRRIADDQVEMTNLSADCAVEVGFAVYLKIDEIDDHQQLFADQAARLDPGATAVLQLELPGCTVQTDIFIGPRLRSLDGSRYGPRLLFSQDIQAGRSCRI